MEGFALTRFIIPKRVSVSLNSSLLTPHSSLKQFLTPNYSSRYEYRVNFDMPKYLAILSPDLVMSRAPLLLR